MSYSFEVPAHHRSIIKVIGVGGGGGNAVNHMYREGIKDVEFVICNTDVQALKSSPIPNKIQIGINLTEGLGAGANPEVGKNAAIENKEEIREYLSTNTRMVFVTAGMGGGTGTGAAPVIAKIARELDILTVGIVTAPFAFEGKKKQQQALKGIEEMRQYCDTILVVMNDKLRELYGNQTISEAFGRADNVLTTAAKSIAEVITVTNSVNVDFNDVCSVMRNSGTAVMGSAVCAGDDRARRAVEEALSSPLLNNTKISGAQKILLCISYGPDKEMSMDELTAITDYIDECVGNDADMFFGQGVDPTLGDQVRVTVICTGFRDEDKTALYQEPIKVEVDLSKNLNANPVLQNVEPEIKEFIRENPFAEQKESSLFDELNESKIEFRMPESQEQRNVLSLDFTEEGSLFNHKSPGLFDETEFRTSTFDRKEEEQNAKAITIEQRELPRNHTSLPPSDEMSEAHLKRIQLSQERIRKLKGLSSHSLMSPDEIKEKLEVPAYKRKNITLNDATPSNERQISRFNMNEDNDLLGNNRFLHDNVD
jgi:cell division protein FtsZ